MTGGFTDEEFRLFSEWLSEEFGLKFGKEKRDILRARLEPRRAELGYGTFGELFFHVKFHPQRRQELDRLLPRLTNNESYFLRERRQLEILEEEVLPGVARRLREEGREEARILSAGCGKGEEAYTLALVARRSGAFMAPRTFSVTGVDLDPAALEQARAGRYTAHSFRGVAPDLRDRWFDPVDEGWKVTERLTKHVNFARVNLANPAWPAPFPAQDVIFCRNVLIYFDDDAIDRALEGLERALLPGGFLFLGHAESLSRFTHPFRTERRPGAVFYRRE